MYIVVIALLTMIVTITKLCSHVYSTHTDVARKSHRAAVRGADITVMLNHTILDKPHLMDCTIHLHKHFDPFEMGSAVGCMSATHATANQIAIIIHSHTYSSTKLVSLYMLFSLACSPFNERYYKHFTPECERSADTKRLFRWPCA